MTKTFAIAGKGGVGKTTFAALLIKYLIDEKNATVLAVDADPNFNLKDKLGVDIEETIGDLREGMIKEEKSIPQCMSKQEYVELNIRRALAEEEKFDLLVMGRQEGPGCYCYINNILRTFLDALSEKYDYAVVDNEAGMEHLSRRTTRDIDVLFTVTDATKPGILTAARIKALAGGLELNIKKICLVLNKIPKEMPEPLKKLAEDNFRQIEYIPWDETIEKYESDEAPIIGLPHDSKAYLSIKKSMRNFE
jgi:CO dehydrogenase maturation factor